MEEEFTLDELREYCSKYIREHFGEQYDMTPWWDKLQIYSFFKHIQEQEIKNEQIRYTGQNEQKTET